MNDNKTWPIKLTDVEKTFEKYFNLDFDIQTPWQLLDYILESLEKTVIESNISEKAKISKYVNIEGPVLIEDNVVIESFTTIKGPTIIREGTYIGNNNLIRHSLIGKNNIIGSTIEIGRTVILNNCTFHRNVVIDSFISDNVMFGGTSDTANARLDKKTIRTLTKKGMENTNKTKLGTIIGKGTKIGGKSLFMPGILVGEDCIIKPFQMICKNVQDDTVL